MWGELERLRKSVQTPTERNLWLVRSQHSHRVSFNISPLNLTPGKRFGSGSVPCQTLPASPNYKHGLLRCISCMCLPCVPGLHLTNGASQHTPCGAWQCHPDVQSQRGAESKGADQGHTATRFEGPVRRHWREGAGQFCWWQRSPRFTAFMIWWHLGAHRGGQGMFSFFLMIHFNSSHS